MLKRLDLIELAEVKLDDFKIYRATGVNPGPLRSFFNGTCRAWQAGKNQKDFQCKHVLSRIYRENARWLFAGVYEIHGCRQRRLRKRIRYQYSTSEVLGVDHFTHRSW